MTAVDPPWYPIRTPRLLIRDFRLEDVEDAHLYGSDPEVARYMPWGPNSPEETAAVMARSLNEQATWPRLDHGFAIQHLASERVIGAIALHLRDLEGRAVEMGYCLNRSFWRQGLVTEAARAMLAVAFETLGLRRVFATCDVRNVGAYAVMEKLGMRREGAFRQDRIVKGTPRDTYLYAILADEWTG